MKKKSSTDILKPYIKYAADLEASEPVIALCCKLYYVEKLLEIKKKAGTAALSDVDNSSLRKIMGEIEEANKELNIPKEDKQTMLQDFCTRVFVALDKEERTAPKIVKDHAVRFNSCSHFIELLSIFGMLTPEWEDKKKYCKFKAANILKCLKEGVEPKRGHPKEEEKKSEEEKKGVVNDVAPPTIPPLPEENKLDVIPTPPAPDIMGGPPADNSASNSSSVNFVMGESVIYDPSKGGKPDAGGISKPFDLLNAPVPPPVLPQLPKPDNAPPPPEEQPSAKFEQAPGPFIPPITPYIPPPQPQPSAFAFPSGAPPPLHSQFPQMQQPFPSAYPSKPAASVAPNAIKRKIDIRNPLNGEGKVMKGHPKYYDVMAKAQKQLEMAIGDLKATGSPKVREYLANALQELDTLEE